jgi:hypothetical protein
MKQLIRKTLLALIGGVMCNAAWAATIATMGNNDEGEASHKQTYILAPNKTLTLTFTVTSTKGENETQGYTVDLRHQGDANPVMYMQPGGGFYYWGDEWWNETHIVKNDRSWGALSDFTAFIPGATVELTIKRIHTQVMYYADITTSTSVRHYRRLISTVGSFTENANLEVALMANYAVLTSITDVTTDESITGTLIGKEDNSVGYSDGAQQAFTIAADKSLELNFINYSSKIGWADNWYLRIEKGEKWLELRSDYWGGESDGAGYYYHSEETSSPGYFTLSSSTGLYFDNFPKALHKANVVMTVERSGNTLTITATQTCTSSEVKTEKYTITHDDFGTGDITFKLCANWAHLDLLPVTFNMNAYGWATFASDYPLDFSKATTGLTAYTITGHSGNTILKGEVTGTVPAGTPLLLKGDANESYNIPIVGTNTTDLGTNLLVRGKGAAVDAGSGVTRYVLGVNGGNAEFQKIVGTAANVSTDKAYLEFEGDVPAHELTFDFDSETTAISELTNTNLTNYTNEYFNLAGQRVANPTKGLYIVNGKNVVVK